MWQYQLVPLARHFKVVRYDMRNHGRSAKAGKRWSDTRDLHSLLQFLGLESAYFVGAAMGGACALDLALAAPEVVDALVLAPPAVFGFVLDFPGALGDLQEDLAPSIPLYVEAQRSGNASKLFDRMMEDPFVMPRREQRSARRLIRRMLEDNVHLWAEPYKPTEILEPHALKRLGEVDVPTLLVTGGQDHPSARALPLCLETEIKGAQWVFIDNATQYVNLDRPDQFNRVVVEFLSSL
jgi:pimeloyl-ACP methyl ester carboxylesterase